MSRLNKRPSDNTVSVLRLFYRAVLSFSLFCTHFWGHGFLAIDMNSVRFQAVTLTFHFNCIFAPKWPASIRSRCHTDCIRLAWFRHFEPECRLFIKVVSRHTSHLCNLFTYNQSINQSIKQLIYRVPFHSWEVHFRGMGRTSTPRPSAPDLQRHVPHLDT
jgi:hypothetical protein